MVIINIFISSYRFDLVLVITVLKPGVVVWGNNPSNGEAEAAGL